MNSLSVFFIAALSLLGSRIQPDEPPGGLMTEFIRDTRGVPILDASPEFTWTVPASAGMQSAYRIIVYRVSSGKNPAGDIAWDSGIIGSANSVAVEYKGDPLLPGTCYRWKVRTWDREKNPSPWSEYQGFCMGKTDTCSTTRNRFIVETGEPVSLSRTGEKTILADFGKAAFGALFLEVKNVTNDTISISLGEKTVPGGRIDSNPGGTIRYSKNVLSLSSVNAGEFRVPLKRDTRNTSGAAVLLPDSLGTVMPFRYCEIETAGDAGSVKVHRKALSYYFDDSESSFTSSDTVLNRIWELCRYSIKATSFAGLYVDGDRERIPYEADAYINQLGHYYTDREYSLARLTNEYFISHPTWPTEWILHTVPMFYNDYLYSGDRESLENFYQQLKAKTLTALAGPDGLISSVRCTDEIMRSIGFSNQKERLRDIVDWPPAQKDTGWKLATAEGERDGHEMKDVNTVVNAFYYNSLLKMAQIAGWLGKPADSVHYAGLARMTLESFNTLLLDNNKGIYTDGIGSDHSSLHSNMLPLAFGMVPGKYLRNVVSFVRSRGMACSVYGAQYLLEGLYRSGEGDFALSLMNSLSDRSWWNMIRSGSTITMEAWDMKYKPNSDWNHAWGAVPANIIPGHLWGIVPVKPGWSKTAVRPQPGNLGYSSISVPTPRGTIKASFFRENGKEKYEVSLPGNMEGEFFIPGQGDLLVLYNNKRQTTGSVKIDLKPGINRIELVKNNDQ